MKRINHLSSLVRVVAMMAIVAIASCSPMQKVLKSQDPNQIYDFAVGLYEAEDWRKAITLFDAIEPNFEGTNREDSLLFFSARSQFKSGDYETATQKLDDFRRRFGRSPFLEDAEGMYTLSYYYLSPGPTRDQTTTKLAIMVIDEFLARYPQSEQCDKFKEMHKELMGRLHEKSFLNAYTYYKIGRFKSAIVAFKGAIKEYPDSEHREELSYYIVASSYKLASNSVLSKKEDRYLQMIDSYITFIAEYPESEYRDEVDDMESKARDYLARRGEAEQDGAMVKPLDKKKKEKEEKKL